jgi:hypothetical protein
VISMAEPQKDPLNNPLNRLLDNPVTYGIGSILVVIMVANGMLDGWYAVILLAVAAFGTYRWWQKRKSV